METYDCIVLGVGAVGSAALSQLASRGARTLGLERFEPGHDRGSSHGHTRAIRLAYFEHPDYVPLLRRSFELWRALDQRASQPLYVETGVLEAGPVAGELIEGVLRSAADHDLEVQELDSAALAKRFPGVRLPKDMRALFEPIGGYLHVEDCIKAMAAEAVAAGAELRTGVTVESWQADGEQYIVQTDRGSFRAASLVLAQGAWSSRDMGGASLPLRVLRKVQLWYKARNDHYTRANGFVPFAMETPSGQVFYGFPELDLRGVKVAEHTSGVELPDPLALDRELQRADQLPVEGFNHAFLPGLSDQCMHHATCMYTESADGHFILDQHAEHARVAYAAGLSGHGFKFAPVLGQALAELALDGGTALPIGFLSSARF